MGLPGGPVENTVHTFNGNLKCFDDTFATIKYKVAHQVATGRTKFGTAADHVCRRAKHLVESEKLLAEERVASNSPLKGNEKLKRAAKSITGRTTIATGDDQDYASMPKPKGRRIGNSRQNSLANRGLKNFETNASEKRLGKHKGSA